MKEKIKGISAGGIAMLSGFCNALLGAGGGILLSLGLGRLFASVFPQRKDILVNSQAAMIPGCALSCLFYAANGSLNTSGFSALAIPAAIGGAAGSFLLSKINSRMIAGIFAVLVIWSGVRMVLG